MKTPTLIVRLVGLYLLGQGTIVLLQIQKMGAMGAGLGMQRNPALGDVQLYAIIDLFLGLTATVFAGRLARVLTFDSGPGQVSDDVFRRIR